MTLNRRKALQTLAVGAGACASPLRGAAARRPNILFVMTDDHAATELSCAGNRVLRTPHMDRLAAEGVRFTNAFVTNSLCAPSRATVLTGCFSHVHGVRGNSEFQQNEEHMNPALPTFPQLLRKAGYKTAVVGKWHLSDAPTGFDYSCVLPGQGAYFDPELFENGTKKKFSGYCTDITTDLALKWLQGVGAEPFCLLYQHKAPHRPFKPAPRHEKLFADIELPYPATFNDDYATRRIAQQAEDMRFDVSLAGDYKDLPQGLTPEARKKWLYQRFVKDHYRATYGVDENLGRVLEWLDRSGRAEDTLVIYTSDNGFFLGEHGWYDKRFMYEPSLRVPLLIRYPRQLRAGSVDAHMVQNVDYAPTILDFCGIPVPRGMQGRSLRPLLEGRAPASWRRSVYYAYYENSWSLQKQQKGDVKPGIEYFTAHRVPPHRGVRTERHKLIHYYGEGDYWELFDLRTDPNELRNMYGEPGQAQITAELKKELARLRRQVRDTQ